jgi:hypothetical protein
MNEVRYASSRKVCLLRMSLNSSAAAVNSLPIIYRLAVVKAVVVVVVVLDVLVVALFAHPNLHLRRRGGQEQASFRRANKHNVCSPAAVIKAIIMFGSWKARVHAQASTAAAAAVGRPSWPEDDDILSEIEEELTAFLNRQHAWPAVVQQQARKLPPWMKTASLNRCSRTPPLPPKARQQVPPPTPPRRRRSCSRSRAQLLLRGSSADLPSIGSSSFSPTPPTRRKRASGASSSASLVRRSVSLQSIHPLWQPLQDQLVIIFTYAEILAQLSCLHAQFSMHQSLAI